MKYSLGLDIGTTSVGWAVINLDKNRIEDLGVRIFERPENPKDGKSLAEPRRTARSARRRLKRRRQRLSYLKNWFIANNLLTRDEIEKILTPHKDAPSPYVLREKGLNEKLSNADLFVALYHIAKRRGYKSNSQAQDQDVLDRIARQKEKIKQKQAAGKEVSGSDDRLKVLSAVYDNREFLVEYKTVAGALNHAEKFAAHKRNKADNYQNSFIRENFENEAHEILNKQRDLGLKVTDEAIEKVLFGGKAKIRDDGIIETSNPGIFYQRPFMNAKLLNGMRGKDFYNNEDRAPKASLTFELFRLAEDISHIKNAKNPNWQITPEQADLIIAKAKSTNNVTYGAVREILGFKNNFDEFDFGYIRGKNPDVKKLKNYENLTPSEKTIAVIKEREKVTFAKMEFYRAIDTALKDFPEKFAELENSPELFDKLGEILTVNKDDSSLTKSLREIGFSDVEIKPLLLLNFAKFGNLSLTTMRKAIPLMLDGKTYDKALEEIYPGKFAAKLSGDKTKLSPLNEDEQNQITNPVVKRAVSQTIKVVNAVILKYGAPTRIHLEAAGDLSKNSDERKKIKNAQDDNAAENDKILERLKTEFNVLPPYGQKILKFKFYREQNGKCPYCGSEITLERVFSDDNYGEVDHITPFSRCGNDGRSNKVLVHNECNQNKRNMTPFEAWGRDNPANWEQYKVLVESMNLPFAKKKRLLAETPPKEDWNVRALNDTRYISKFMSGFIRKNLNFSGDGDGKQKVFTPTGQTTSYLRRAWHVGNKNRETNNLHHAIDAAIIALTDQGTIDRISRMNHYFELFNKEKEDRITDKITGEIFYRKDLDDVKADVMPWPDFDKELRLRADDLIRKNPDTKEEQNISINEWRQEFDGVNNLYADDPEFCGKIQPIFVSRMPKRNGTGSTNQDTLRSPRGVKNPEKISLIRKHLTDVKLADLENSPIKTDDKKLYEQLAKLLRENNDDPKKAFAMPVYKNDKKIDQNGKPISPVKTIKVDDSKNVKSGVLLNNDKTFVNNGSTICLDIFTHEKGIFAAPIYAHLVNVEKHGKFEKVAILPQPNGRSKDDKGFWDSLRAEDGKIHATRKNGFEKLFSVFPNDYLIIETRAGEHREGYYVKYGVGSGNIVLVSHSSSDKNDQKHINVGVGTTASIKKLDLSILGNNYKWV